MVYGARTFNTLLRSIRDQTHCLEKVFIKLFSYLYCWQNIGYMVLTCCDHITGAPTNSLVDHKNKIKFKISKTTEFSLPTSKGAIYQCKFVRHPISGRTLWKLPLMWQVILRSQQPSFFVSQEKLIGFNSRVKQCGLFRILCQTSGSLQGFLLVLWMYR